MEGGDGEEHVFVRVERSVFGHRAGNALAGGEVWHLMDDRW
jgi:hypothetical protein